MTSNITKFFIKVTILITLIISLVLQSYAQRNRYYNSGSETKFVGGILGGMTFSQVNGDGFKGYDRIGFTGGGIIFLPMPDVELPGNGMLAYSMSVLFNQKGAEGKDLKYGINKQVINLNYAEVPFHIYYYRGIRKSNIGLGLSLGYLGYEESLLDKGTGLQVVENHYKKFDLSIVLSPNIHIWNGIFISPSLQYSLLNIKNDIPPVLGNPHQYNEQITLRVMYLFGKEK